METGKKWFDEAHHRQAKKSFAILLLIILISGICGMTTAATPTEIEDFNSYESDYELWDVWIDGINGGNGTQSEISLDAYWSGNSMRYEYFNSSGTHYSKAWADICDLPSEVGSDWTAGGAEALVLYFYGQAGNPTSEQMFVKLTDGDTPAKSAAVGYGDMNGITEAEWHEWNIVLQDFVDANDVNLANVSRITIGFGDGSGTSDGTVYFNDIRLYPPRCIHSLRTEDFVALDYAPVGLPISGDCRIDYKELEIMARDWLTTDTDINTSNPGDVNLVGYWKMDVWDGNTVFSEVDYNKPNDYAATYLVINDEEPVVLGPDALGDEDGNSIYFDTYEQGAKLQLGSTWDPVGAWDPCERTGNLTVAIWQKCDGPRVPHGGQAQGLICKRGGWSDGSVRFMFEMMSPPAAAGTHDPPVGWEDSFALRSYCTSVYSPPYAVTPHFGLWTHLAATCEGHTVRFYINGKEIPQENLLLRLHQACLEMDEFSFGLGVNNAYITIGNTIDEGGWNNCPGVFNGHLDEARIYDRALDANEIAYLADTTPTDGKLYIPLVSPAELYYYEDEGQRVVNFKDFAVLADNWLEEQLWP